MFHVKHLGRMVSVTSVMQFLNQFQVYILMGILVIIIILFIMTVVNLKALSRVESRYRKLMRGSNNKNLEELIVNYLDKVDEAKETSIEIRDKCLNIEEKLKYSVQKMAVIRYRAFDDVGSDLSYSVALLDQNNSGVILTGIFGRNESTTYAKPIDKGISRYDLSEEEQQALENAINFKGENEKQGK